MHYAHYNLDKYKGEKLEDRKNYHPGWGGGSGHIIYTKWQCICGGGYVIYEKDDIPGFKDWDTYFECDKCKKTYLEELKQNALNK